MDIHDIAKVTGGTVITSVRQTSRKAAKPGRIIGIPKTSSDKLNSQVDALVAMLGNHGFKQDSTVKCDFEYTPIAKDYGTFASLELHVNLKAVRALATITVRSEDLDVSHYALDIPLKDVTEKKIKALVEYVNQLAKIKMPKAPSFLSN